MEPGLRNSLPNARWTGLLVAAGLACASAGCDDGPAAGGPARPDRPASSALDWRPGGDQGFIAHDEDRQVVRCWKVQGRFDCLVARSIGLNRELPGAPGRLLFYRFRSAVLPATQQDLDKLATSDGYACELATLPGRAVVTESFWQAGRIAFQRASEWNRESEWTAEDVAVFGAPAASRAARPYFACARVIDPVTDVGLYALDSGLVTYESVFSAVDHPAPAPAEPSGGPEAPGEP